MNGIIVLMPSPAEQERTNRSLPEQICRGKLRATVADHNSRKKSCVPAVPSSLPHLRNDADIDMDFALIDHDTAVFALDNVIYKMVRAPTQ
jgi:hypothetical protein